MNALPTAAGRLWKTYHEPRSETEIRLSEGASKSSPESPPKSGSLEISWSPEVNDIPPSPALQASVMEPFLHNSTECAEIVTMHAAARERTSSFRRCSSPSCASMILILCNACETAVAIGRSLQEPIHRASTSPRLIPLIIPLSTT